MRIRLTSVLIVANISIYVLQLSTSEWLTQRFALWPINAVPGSTSFEPWQLLTYGFLHLKADFSHLFNVSHIALNMVTLYLFGPEVETRFGAGRFLLYYIVCVLGAGLAALAVMAFVAHPYWYVLGASGGVYGILLAYGVLFPRRRFIDLPIGFFGDTLPVITLFGLIELLLGIFATQPGVAHFAHLGGMAAGYLLILYWRHVRR